MIEISAPETLVIGLKRNRVMRSLYTLRPGDARVEVAETEDDGCALVCFTFARATNIVEWKPLKKAFGWLDQQNADGAMWIERDGGVEAHVVECKRTINLETWGKARRQFLAYLRRMFALAGPIGVRFSQVFLYTAYRKDELSPEESPDPIGEKNLSDSGELDPVVAGDASWCDPELLFADFTVPIPHVHVQLDAAGTAAVAR